MKKQAVLVSYIFVVLLAFTGCKTSVDRVAIDKQVDLSGRWNDTDSQLVSAEMVADIAKRPWIEDYTSKHGKKPVVIVGTVRNKSSEHIETETFTKDLERELINNGRLKFVANARERGELRGERLGTTKLGHRRNSKTLGRRDRRRLYVARQHQDDY